MMELESKERFGKQSRGLSMPFKLLQASSCLVLSERLALLIRIWLQGLCGGHMPNSGWAEQTEGMLQLCEESKGLPETIGGLETQPVLTGLVRGPKAGPGFLLGYSLSMYEMGELLAVMEVTCCAQGWYVMISILYSAYLNSRLGNKTR